MEAHRRERASGAEAVPPWLPQFLRASYFSPCPHHAALHKSERNFFCTDCRGEGSLCSICVQREHAGHSVLQIRKSSYHDAVRINDVSRLLDLSAIQVYVINGAKIVFLNGRPQARPVKGAPYHCETCQRTLLDAARFCSIACKLDMAPEDPSLLLAPKRAASSGQAHGALSGSDEESYDSGMVPPVHRGHKRRHLELPALVPEDHEEASSADSGDSRWKGGMEFERSKRGRRESGKEEVNSWTSPPSASSWRALGHKRKGIPHRSPLA